MSSSLLVKLPVRILLLAAANTAGFFTMAFCYFLGVRSGRLEIGSPSFNAAALHHDFTIGMATWAVCAAFSLAYLFLKGKERLFFLWAPVVIPLGYGLSVLLGLFSR